MTRRTLGGLIISIRHRLETSPEAAPIAGAHETLARRLVDDTRGLGPLGPMLRDPDVSDIMVNGLESVCGTRRAAEPGERAVSGGPQSDPYRALGNATTVMGGVGEIPMCDLLKNALRMRPDRIIVGEVRGPEALDALQAMNTGHPGSMFTVDVINPRDTLGRLEYLVMMESGEMPLSAIRNQVVSAVDLIVQVAGFRDGTRRVTAITDIAGLEGDVAVLEDVWSFDTSDGRYKSSGNRPSFVDRIEDLGLGDELDAAVGRLHLAAGLES